MYRKQLITTLLLINFLSMMFIIPEGPLIIDDQQKTDPSEQLEDFIHFSSLLTQPDESENTWNSGESVHLDHDYVNSYPGFDDINYQLQGYLADSVYDNGRLDSLRRNDTVYKYQLTYTDADDDEIGQLYVQFRMKIYALGTIYVGYSIKLYDDLSGSSDMGFVYYSIDVTNDHIDSNVYVNLHHQLFYGSTWVSHPFYIFNNFGEWESFGTTSNWNHGLSSISSALFGYCYVGFQPDTVEEEIRSNYRYPSPTQKMHEVTFTTKPYEYVNLSYSEEWTFSSINPSLSYTDNNNRLDIYSIDFFSSVTVLFTSNCSYHLTTQDVSSNYLSDIGFENGQYLNDWSTNGTAQTTTAQWFSGYYSLETHTPELLYREFFADEGDECDFEEDVDEFDIKLSGLDVLTTITHDGEDKLHLEETTGYVIGNGARRDNLAINTNTYTTFGTEIYLYKALKPDRVKITLHFSDASTQDHVEMISSGNTVAFNFTITSDKIISDIDIYYGDASWNNGVGDKIYVSYIKIFHEWIDPYEISLSLPLDDYYFNFGVRSEGTTTINIVEIDRDIEITLLDTWEQVFYYAHTDSVTLSITPYSLTSLVFFDNFKISQTSTTITTDEPSKYEIESTLRAWDGRNNHLMPFEEITVESWDRCDQILEHSYNVTTNEFGIATVEHLVGLEHKEYILKTFSLDSDFTLSSDAYYYDQPTEDQDLTDWGNVNVVPTFIESFDSDETKYGDVSYSATMVDNNADGGFQYVSDYSIDLNNYDKLCFWMKSNVSTSGTGDLYVWSSLGYTQGGLSSANKLDFYTDWTFYSIDLRYGWFTISNASVFDDAMYFRFDIDYNPAKIVHIDDLHFLHAVKLYFTPSVPAHTDYAETVLEDTWDWTEGDTDTWDSYDLEVYTIENGRAIAESNCLTSSDGIFSYTDYPISSDYYTVYLRAKANRTQQFMYWIQTDISAHGVYFTIIPAWRIFEISLSDWIGEEVTETRIQTTSTGDAIKIEFDFIKFVHKDSFLPQTNDYATDELLDAWDFEEGDFDFYVSESGYDVSIENGYLKNEVDIDSTYQYISSALDLNIDSEHYTHLVLKYNIYAEVSTEINQFAIRVYNNGGGSNHLYYISITSDQNWHTVSLDVSYYTVTDRILIYLMNTTSATIPHSMDGDGFLLECIYLIHQEELTYTVIQNSVLLESETNDLLYDLYLDWNLVGTFSDLSLIPLIATVGTHYIQVQPYRTDDSYITQNIYTWYYEIDSPAFSVNIHTFIPSDDYFNIYTTSNYDYTYETYTNSTIPDGSGSGLAEGTYLIIPKLKEAGLFNLTIVFTHGAETVLFMTWYSNLIPPLHPLNDLHREQSDGYYNISLYTNLETYWIDVYHDEVLIDDDSTATHFSILKDTLVGYHNITLLFIYNCSTDSEGYPVAEYNISIPYYFSYEVVFFYDVRIRYLPEGIGLAIGELFEIGWVKTYFDGVLVLDGNINDVPDHSNFTLLGVYDIRIKNTMPIHNLVVTDLLDTVILNITIDISDFVYRIVELPVFLLGVVNLDTVSHRLAVQAVPPVADWILSPIIAPGLFFKFWFHEGVYAFRIYTSTNYTDSNGVLITLWDDYEYLQPGELPIMIEIGLMLDEPIETETTETNIPIMPILMSLFLISIISIKRKLRCKTK